MCSTRVAAQGAAHARSKAGGRQFLARWRPRWCCASSFGALAQLSVAPPQESARGHRAAACTPPHCDLGRRQPRPDPDVSTAEQADHTTGSGTDVGVIGFASSAPAGGTTPASPRAPRASARVASAGQKRELHRTRTPDVSGNGTSAPASRAISRTHLEPCLPASWRRFTHSSEAAGKPAATRQPPSGGN